MPRLEILSEVQRRMLEFFPCVESDDVPWTPLDRDLSDSTVAIVTTAGLHLRDDKPFNRDHPGGESTYRIIPSDSDTADIVQSHFSIGFDRTAIYRDINITFPIDRMRELVEQGEIGGLAPNNYSFMGALRDCTIIAEQTGPEVAQRLKDEGVNLVFLTPT
jgi:D-proline reductase (dithiol) PrdB